MKIGRGINNDLHVFNTNKDFPQSSEKISKRKKTKLKKCQYRDAMESDLKNIVHHVPKLCAIY